MSATEVFFDTNILLYLLSDEVGKADRAEAVVAAGGVISVQVLNEFATVASRKLHMPWAEVCDVLGTVRQVCRVEPLTLETHDRGLFIVQHYGFALYDSMIVAAALLAGCEALYSEDLQHGQRIEDQLTVLNPFV